MFTLARCTRDCGRKVHFHARSVTFKILTDSLFRTTREIFAEFDRPAAFLDDKIRRFGERQTRIVREPLEDRATTTSPNVTRTYIRSTPRATEARQEDPLAAVPAARWYPGLARGHLDAQGLPRTVAPTTSAALPASGGEAAVPSRVNLQTLRTGNSYKMAAGDAAPRKVESRNYQDCARAFYRGRVKPIATSWHM